MSEIRTKREFIKLYMEGVLGNRFRIWTSVEEALRSDIKLVGFREIGIAGGGKFEMVKRDDFLETERVWKAEGRKFYLNEGDYETQKRATIQGEICRTTRGWECFVGPANVYKMRDMFRLQLAKAYHGLAARLILSTYCNESSLADIDALFEIYPDAVVEFTCYHCHVGVIPGRNTIIWEVRNY